MRRPVLGLICVFTLLAAFYGWQFYATHPGLGERASANTTNRAGLADRDRTPAQPPPVAVETKPATPPPVAQEAKPTPPPAAQETKPPLSPPVVRETKPPTPPPVARTTRPPVANDAVASGKVAASKENLKRIALTLQNYFADHQRYPTTLVELVPKYMTVVPLEPCTNQAYFYIPISAPPTAYILTTGHYAVGNPCRNILPGLSYTPDLGMQNSP